MRNLKRMVTRVAMVVVMGVAMIVGIAPEGKAWFVKFNANYQDNDTDNSQHNSHNTDNRNHNSHNQTDNSDHSDRSRINSDDIGDGSTVLRDFTTTGVFLSDVNVEPTTTVNVDGDIDGDLKAFSDVTIIGTIDRHDTGNK